jgi:hypothetical protein
VGGYNPLTWDKNSSLKSTNNSFIFLFTSRNDIHSAKVVYSLGSPGCIQCTSTFGPVFGNDLYETGNENWYSN